jgi:hypothetical protein
MSTRPKRLKGYEMTITEYIARQTERIADSLAHFIAATPEDKLAWHPSCEGSAHTRSILEQVSECVHVNRMVAALLRGSDVSQLANLPDIHFANGQDAQEQLVSSARELSSALRVMTDDDLTRVYNHPRAQMAGENLIMSCYRNMAYHAGQANFIQVLYGDAEFHVPPTWR